MIRPLRRLHLVAWWILAPALAALLWAALTDRPPAPVQERIPEALVSPSRGR